MSPLQKTADITGLDAVNVPKSLSNVGLKMAKNDPNASRKNLYNSSSKAEPLKISFANLDDFLRGEDDEIF